MNYFKLFFFSLIVFVFNNNAFSADAVKGEKLFTKCKACHNADAPKHVERIKELISEKFYDGLKFHRVIDGFMAQTGDPKGNGTGGSGQNIPAEFNSLPHIRGTVSMARAQDPDSADSQFFICFKESSFLNGQYTAWGQVIEGMEFVDKIKKGTGDNGTVDDPDTIISMRLAKEVN